MTRANLQRLLTVLLLLGVGFVYARSFDFPFVNYDDPTVIVENDVIEGATAGNVRRVFTEVRDNAYLPFYYASYWIDHAFAGKRPAVYHIVNVIFHAINVVLILALLLRLRFSTVEAGIAAAVFALHPVVVESAAWASGRKDLISLAAILGALLVFVRGLETGRMTRLVVVPAILFLIGVFAKGTVVVFPLLAGLVALRVGGLGDDGDNDNDPDGNNANAPSKSRRRFALAVFTVIAISAVVTHLLIARSQGTATLGGESFVVRATGMLAVFGRYVGHLVWPVGLSVHYEQDFDGFGVASLNGLLLFVLFVGFAIRFLRRAIGPVTMGAAWLLIALMPVNNLFPRIAIAMADRYLYVGVIGFGLVLGGLIGRIRPARFAAVTGMAVAVILALLARDRVNVWESSEALWRDAVAADEDAALPRIQLGQAIEARLIDLPPSEARGVLERARATYAEARARSRPGIERLQAELAEAQVLVRLGRFDDALAGFDRIAASDPESRSGFTRRDEVNLALNRAAALIGLGRYADAREVLDREATSDVPDIVAKDVDMRRAQVDILDGLTQLQPMAETNHDGIASARSDYERGLSRLEDLATRFPDDRVVRIEHLKALSAAEWIPDHLIEMTRVASELVGRWPEDAATRYHHAQIVALTDPAQATLDLKVSLRLDPYREDAYVLLFQLLRQAQQNKNAKLVLDKGLEQIPDSHRLKRELAEFYLSTAYHHRTTKSPRLAVEAAGRALELIDDLDEARLVRGEVCEELAGAQGLAPEERGEWWRKARDDFEQVLSRDAESPRARFGLARYHKARGYAAAWEATKTGDAAEAKPRKRQLRRQAMEAFETAIKLAPNYQELEAARDQLRSYARARYDEGTSALRDGDLEGAWEFAEEAVRFDPNDPENYCLLAQVAGVRRMRVEQMAAYRKALEVRPGHLRASFEFGKILYVRHVWHEALELLDGFASKAAQSDFADHLSVQIEVAKELAEKCREEIAAAKKKG